MDLIEEGESSSNINDEMSGKRKYCDRHFKAQLAKALKINLGEAENFDKIKANKLLACYDPEKIIDFTNSVAADIQNSIEESIKDPRTKEIIELTRNVDHLTYEENRTQELPLLMKLNSVSMAPSQSLTNNVNFDALNKYLYSVMSGSLDYVDMNYETKLVLSDTYKMLMDQVEKDAPKILEDIRSGMVTMSRDGAENDKNQNISELLQNNSLNPFNLPIELLLQNKTPK